MDSQLQGLAIDPSSGNLYVLGSAEQTLYEYSPSGQLISTRDLSQQGLTNPQGMVFAPSGDSTDDPDNLNLYIADSGSGSEQDLASSHIVELSLQAPELMALPAVNTSASMVQTRLC